MKGTFLLTAIVGAAVCLAFAGCKDPGGDDSGKDPDGNGNGNNEEVLINGVRWATTNVAAPGTFAAALNDFGMYYQWGKKVGWSTSDPLVSSDGATTWDITEYVGDKWLSGNDPCPDGWRVPTLDEFEALCDEDAVDIGWRERNGVNGRLFTDKTTDKSIFLPAAGYRHDFNSSIGRQHLSGFYWSSEAHTSEVSHCLSFDSTTVSTLGGDSSTSGNSVRCVRP